MPPIYRQSRIAIFTAALATCLAPNNCFGQGDFVPFKKETVSRVIELQPRAEAGKVFSPTVQEKAVERVTPPTPVANATTRRTATGVAYEVIQANAKPKAAAVAPVISGDAFSKPTIAKKTKPTYLAKTSKTKVTRKASEINRSTTTPVVTVEIESDKQVNVLEDTNLLIRMRNAGAKKLKLVEFSVELPEHAKFVSSKPALVSTPEGKFIFAVQDLAANQEATLSLVVKPTEKKPLELVTRVDVIEHQTTVVSVKQPQLKLTVNAPEQMNIGEIISHVVTIENVGDGIARGVRLQGNFPDQLRFIKQEGMSAPKDLAPGEILEVVIDSLATLPGQVALDFTAEGNRVATAPVGSPLKISQPELKVLAAGPNMNFVDRDGIYSIKVDNSGEVDVSNVAVTLTIPKGMKVNTINRQAKMDDAHQTLTWTFDKIPAKSNETIQLKAVFTTAGEQVCRILVASNETKKSEFSLKTAIASRADLSISMANNSGPVQVGSKATLDVTVLNKGSQSADDIVVKIELPSSLMAVAQENVVVDEASNSITFTNRHIEAGKKLSFSFQAIGVAKGEHIVRSALKAGGSERRVIVEDSVYVYEANESRISENLTPVFPR